MAKGFKVAVVGAAGGIGQPLSLLLKLNPKVHRLSLYDVVPLVTGVAVDISHLDTPANVTSNFGKEGGALEAALKDADVVVIPAGVPRKPGMTRDDLFSINAGIVRGIAEAAATACPNALIAVISNPVNSMVPVFVEALAKRGIDASKRVFGVTTLDLIRANRFVSVAKGSCPLETRVPVIAGHSGNTIIPLLSQTTPAASFTEEEIVALTSRIQNAGTEVVDAKAGAGSATLSTAQAGAQFVDSLLRGLLGEANVLDYAYVKSTVVPGVDYFSSQILLGPNGAEEIRGFGTLTAYEQKILDDCIPSLQQNISDGVTFVNK